MSVDREQAPGEVVHPPTVVVTGFMGTGKTSVCRELAAILGVKFIDTDELIERAAGRSVAQIFAEDGEKQFRKMERAVCEKLADKRGVVIAAGGGTMIDDGNYTRFAEHAKLVLLEASVDTLAARLSADANRPLLHVDGKALEGDALRAQIEALLAERASMYDRIATRIDTSSTTPAEAAARVASSIDLPIDSLVIDPAHSSNAEGAVGRHGRSRIAIGRGALSTIGQQLEHLGLTTHAFLVMPEITRELFLPQIAESLDGARIPHSVIDIEDGDAKKNITQTQAIIDRLIECGARRDAVVIPVGGGVTGDIGGFAASLFMRGVPLVQVPTTLLAQVDSSIGGKVGVNHPSAKNLIGAFYQPHVVINDPCTLRTLPIDEVANGMAEVVKAALIGSGAFFSYLEGQKSSDPHARLRDITFLERCVREAAWIKCDIVNEDPYERNRRRHLNLGHTVGHALEASAKYQGLKHGQAVSLGMIVAFRLSVDRGTATASTLDRVRSLLSWCGLPVALDAFDRDTVAHSLQLDKKIRNNRIHFVLPAGIGKCEVVDDTTIDEIITAMQKEQS